MVLNTAVDCITILLTIYNKIGKPVLFFTLTKEIEFKLVLVLFIFFERKGFSFV